MLVYLQGGPGHESPRPTGNPRGPGWLDWALKEFRVLLLDQRGTGRSTPVTRPRVRRVPHALPRRRDRPRLPRRCATALGSEPWTVLGQSYGGLCILTYLSFAPDGLREALITGGVPGIGMPVDDIYRATWARMMERNRRYYARYPAGPRADARAARLEPTAAAERRPADARRLRTSATGSGMSDGFERAALHPRAPAATRRRSWPTSRDPLELDRNPIYALLHEACWADGGVTNWSAQRSARSPTMPPEYFTAEHILPWMFEEYGH